MALNHKVTLNNWTSCEFYNHSQPCDIN